MFFEILSAINDPNQQASVGQLDEVTKSLQQVAVSEGIHPNQMHSMLGVLGANLSPLLKQQQAQMGVGKLATMLGKADNLNSLKSIVTPQQQQQLAQTISQKTGMQSTLAQALLPQMLPIIMKLLSMGTPTSGSVQNNNVLLDTFLNGGHSKNTDLGNVMKFANRFLNAAV